MPFLEAFGFCIFFLTGKEEFHEELSVPEGNDSSLKHLTGNINTICLLYYNLLRNRIFSCNFK